MPLLWKRRTFRLNMPVSPSLITVSAIVDSGSAGNFISGDLARTLQLRRTRTSKPYSIHAVTGEVINHRAIYLAPNSGLGAAGSCSGQVKVLEERCGDPVVFVNDNLRPTLEVCDTKSFGCLPCDKDVLSTAASDSEDLLDEVRSSLPLSGQEKCTSLSYSELLDIVTRTVDKLGLEWDSEPAKNQAQLKLDDRFLYSLITSQPCRPLPFFQVLHHKISRSWKQPFSVCITNPADFATVSKMAEHGYAVIPAIEKTLVLNSAPSWKSCPLLPCKQCRIMSALVGKSYMAAGQAAAVLHSMGVLQAYQADVLKGLDEGEGLTPEAVKELRQATDLVFRGLPSIWLEQ
ncbi:hypothetical protein cypCar_00043644 [Cyprinus carpio]|nr:hypothetical protein cypCar_00043644 [Cyprinus carpio]